MRPRLRLVAPWSGATMPSRTRTSVVLPPPLGPISVTISPAEMSISTPSRIVRPARVRESARALIKPATSCDCVPPLLRSSRRPHPPSASAASVSASAGAPEGHPVASLWPPMLLLPPLAGARRAQAPYLDHRAVGGKCRPVCRFVDGAEHLIGFHLGHAAASLARQHQLAHGVDSMAGKEGVAALEAMHNARSYQRVDRAIDRDRCHPLPPRGELIEHLVGADDLVRGGDLAQHRLPQRRELKTLGGKRSVRARHRLLEATLMVVLGCRKRAAGRLVGHRTL